MSISIIGSSPVTVTENGTERELFYNDGGSGGSGGTTVVANPDGSATDALEKLQVGSTIYSVADVSGGVVIANVTIVDESTDTLDIKPSDVFTDGVMTKIVFTRFFDSSTGETRYELMNYGQYTEADGYVINNRENVFPSYTASSANDYFTFSYIEP